MRYGQQMTVADKTYHALMAAETYEGDAAFDRHVIACILAISCDDVAAGIAESFSEASGLAPDEIAVLASRHFPATGKSVLAVCSGRAAPADSEEMLLLDLLLGSADMQLEFAPQMAKMVVRRSMQDNHLWQDLGLFSRSELSRLLRRYFPELAAGNTNDMKWKKFFYRKLCEGEGSVLCTAPSCRQCADFADCFGAEDGESRLARIRNGHALTV